MIFNQYRVSFYLGKKSFLFTLCWFRSWSHWQIFVFSLSSKLGSIFSWPYNANKTATLGNLELKYDTLRNSPVLEVWENYKHQFMPRPSTTLEPSSSSSMRIINILIISYCTKISSSCKIPLFPNRAFTCKRSNMGCNSANEILQSFTEFTLIIVMIRTTIMMTNGHWPWWWWLSSWSSS